MQLLSFLNNILIYNNNKISIYKLSNDSKNLILINNKILSCFIIKIIPLLNNLLIVHLENNSLLLLNSNLIILYEINFKKNISSIPYLIYYLNNKFYSFHKLKNSNKFYYQILNSNLLLNSNLKIIQLFNSNSFISFNNLNLNLKLSNYFNNNLSFKNLNLPIDSSFSYSILNCSKKFLILSSNLSYLKIYILNSNNFQNFNLNSFILNTCFINNNSLLILTLNSIYLLSLSSKNSILKNLLSFNKSHDFINISIINKNSFILSNNLNNFLIYSLINNSYNYLINNSFLNFKFNNLSFILNEKNIQLTSFKNNSNSILSIDYKYPNIENLINSKFNKNSNLIFYLNKNFYLINSNDKIYLNNKIHLKNLSGLKNLILIDNSNLNLGGFTIFNNFIKKLNLFNFNFIDDFNLNFNLFDILNNNKIIIYIDNKITILPEFKSYKIKKLNFIPNNLKFLNSNIFTLFNNNSNLLIYNLNDLNNPINLNLDPFDPIINISLNNENILNILTLSNNLLSFDLINKLNLPINIIKNSLLNSSIILNDLFFSKLNNNIYNLSDLKLIENLKGIYLNHLFISNSILILTTLGLFKLSSNLLDKNVKIPIMGLIENINFINNDNNNILIQSNKGIFILSKNFKLISSLLINNIINFKFEPNKLFIISNIENLNYLLLVFKVEKNFKLNLTNKLLLNSNLNFFNFQLDNLYFDNKILNLSTLKYLPITSNFIIHSKLFYSNLKNCLIFLSVDSKLLITDISLNKLLFTYKNINDLFKIDDSNFIIYKIDKIYHYNLLLNKFSKFGLFIGENRKIQNLNISLLSFQDSTVKIIKSGILFIELLNYKYNEYYVNV